MQCYAFSSASNFLKSSWGTGDGWTMIRHSECKSAVSWLRFNFCHFSLHFKRMRMSHLILWIRTGKMGVGWNRVQCRVERTEGWHLMENNKMQLPSLPNTLHDNFNSPSAVLARMLAEMLQMIPQLCLDYRRSHDSCRSSTSTCRGSKRCWMARWKMSSANHRQPIDKFQMWYWECDQPPASHDESRAIYFNEK